MGIEQDNRVFMKRYNDNGYLESCATCGYEGEIIEPVCRHGANRKDKRFQCKVCYTTLLGNYLDDRYSATITPSRQDVAGMLVMAIHFILDEIKSK